MRFGKIFLEQQRPEWAGHYLCYESLKEWIYRNEGLSPEEARQAFTQLVQKECLKVHNFRSIAQGGSSAGPSESTSSETSYLSNNPSMAVSNPSVEDLTEFATLNQKALSKIAKKFHKNFSGAPSLPLESLLALLTHGTDGDTEVVFHSHEQGAVDEEAPLLGEAKRERGKGVRFAKEPVVSVHVYESQEGCSVHVMYTVPAHAWFALAGMLMVVLPVTPLLWESIEGTHHGVAGFILKQCLIELGTAVAMAVLWAAAWWGNLVSWGGDHSRLVEKGKLLRVLAMLVISGVCHVATIGSAVQAAYKSTGACGGDNMCPPVLLESLAPLLLCLHHALRRESLYPQEVGVALLVLVAASLHLVKKVGGLVEWEADLWAAVSSVTFAIDLIADRSVAELPPAACIVIKRLVALVIAAVIALSSGALGLPSGLSRLQSLQWVSATILSWTASALTYFTLRHLTIVTVSVWLTVGTLSGGVVLNAVLWSDDWHLYRTTGPIVITIGIVASILAVVVQLRYRSKVEVPVFSTPRKPRGIKRRWCDGDVLGCAVDIDAKQIFFGLNGNWDTPYGLAFSGAGFTAIYPALTAGEGFEVVVNPTEPKFGPPSPGFLPYSENFQLELLRGREDDVECSNGRVIFHDYATVGAPTAVRESGKVFYEIVMVRVGEMPQLGWASSDFEIYRGSECTAGVGDDRLSWGADGKRPKVAVCARWHKGKMLVAPWPGTRRSELLNP